MESSRQAAVFALLDAQVAAWNAGDLVEFCRTMASDVAYVNGEGVTRGRDALLSLYLGKFPDAPAMGQLSLDIDSVTVDQHMASVVAFFTLTQPKQTQCGWTLLTFIQREGRWYLYQDATFALVHGHT